MFKRISRLGYTAVAFMLLMTGVLAPIVANVTSAASPPRLIDLTITDKVAGGGQVKLTVTLSKVATTDVRVALKSANPAIVKVPAAVIVKAGRSTGDTQATTVKVSKRTTVLLTATLGNIVTEETVAILPVQLVSVTAPSTMDAGSSVEVTVRISEPAPSTGVVIRLSGNRHSILHVPETVDILPSRETARFTVTADLISKDTPVLISAKLSGSPNATDTVTILTLNPPTATATATASSTATTVASSTATDVATSTATDVASSTATDVASSTATAVATSTSTDTPATSTSTSVPTATATPAYVLTVDVLTFPSLGIPFATVRVCLTNPTPNAADVDLTVSDTEIAGLDLNHFTLGTLLDCKILLLVGVLDGTVTVTANSSGLSVTSEPITFGFPTATATSVPATSTATSVPATSTATEIPPTATNTVGPGTATSTQIPATATSTATTIPTSTNTATATATPQYILTVDVLTLPVLGIPVATVKVCLTNPSPDAATIDLTVSDTQIAGLNLNQFTLGTLFNCQILLLTGLLDGTVTVTASTHGIDVTSEPITFGFPTATATSVPATSTATLIPATTTATAVPATSTPIPATATNTAVPPTATATVAPQYLVTFEVLQAPILGILPATVNVCLTDPNPSAVNVNLNVSDSAIAGLNVNQITLDAITHCQNILVTGLLDGSITLTADVNGLISGSSPISFTGPTVTFTTITPPLFGVVPATVSVCWSNPVQGDVLFSGSVTSTNPNINVIDINTLQFTTLVPCQLVVLGTLASSGDAKLKVTINGVDYFSDNYHFGL